MDKNVGVLRTHKEKSDVAEGSGTKFPIHASRKFTFINDMHNNAIAEMCNRPDRQRWAELIERSVNSHDALLKACKLAASVLSGEIMHKQGLIDALESIRTALAKGTPGDTVSADGTSSLYESSLNKSNPAASGGAE